MDALTRTGEVLDEAGSIPSTIWLMSAEEAQTVADKILELAKRYGQDEPV